MAAFDPATLDRWRTLAIVDRDGTTVGTVSEFYLDRQSGHPTWALVETGLFGAALVFIPLVSATEISDGLQVPYEKDHIRDSPRIDPHDELTPDEEAILFAHYGVEYEPQAAPDPGAAGSPTPLPGDTGTVDTPGTPPAEPGSLEGPGPVPTEPRVAGSPDAGGVEPGSGERGGRDSAEPGATESPDARPADPGSGEPGGTGPAEPTAAGPPHAGPMDADAEAPGGPSSDEPRASGPPGDARPGSTGAVPTQPEPSDPASRPAGAEAAGAASPDPWSPSSTSAVPRDPSDSTSTGADHADRWAAEPADATLVEPTGPVSTPEQHSEDRAGAEPDVSRPAPTDQEVSGSTSATASGPTPMTFESDVDDPAAQFAYGPPRAPRKHEWGPDYPPTDEEDQFSARPTRASDRWREAKLAAERDRVERTAAAQPEEQTAAAQPEERSALGRARRRLGRLVGGGQAAEPEAGSPTDKDVAEQARGGPDEDDPRHR
jgi:PRC-barrel domain